MINLVIFIYAVLSMILFFYSMHSFVLLYYYFKFRNKKLVRPKKKLIDFPNVTIQLPIYNEKYVVHRLLRSVAALDYPKNKLEIQVLDDSNDETTEIVAVLVEQYRAENYDVKHIKRDSRAGFKAGALQYGLDLAKGDYMAIFDADFVPPADFLKELLPEFDAANIAGVQARWGYLNDKDSLLTRAQAIGLDNHFAMEQHLRSLADCFINFNGTCAIWLKSAILDAGGWHSDTLAEDLDLSYRVQLGGWKIKYREDFIVPGELPENADSYRIQQNRWAKGTIQVAKKLLPEVLKAPLRPVAKYEAFVHLTCHINFLAMLGLAIFSLPIIYFKVEGLVSNGYYVFLSFFTIGALGYPLLFFLSQKVSYRDYLKRVPYIICVIAYSMGLSISNTKAIIEGWLNRKNIFTRTPKSGGTKNIYQSEPISLVSFLEVILGVYIFIGLIYVVANLQLILIPFLFFYSLGFLSLGFSSMKDGISNIMPQEALCSEENS